MSMIAFGQWVKSNRLRLEMTQEELAARVGCSPTYISTLERATPHSKTDKPTRPSETLVEALADVFSVKPDTARLLAGYASEAELKPDVEITQIMDGLNKEQQRLVVNAARAFRDALLSAPA